MIPSKKLIHILGGGLWQLPTIKLAKELGLAVLVTDMYENAAGYRYSDYHEVVDISKRDATLSVARSYGIDGIICDTTDVGVSTAAYVAEHLGLPGIGLEVASRFTNKHLMRAASSRKNIHNPRFVLAATEKDLAQARSIGYPLVVKPVAGQSSRGIRKVSNAVELREAFHLALRNSTEKQVILEQWIEGTEVTVEAMCQDGVVYVLGISDKEHYAKMPQIASRLTYPAAFADEVLKRIADTNAAVIHALGLRTGVTHAEYIVTADASIYLVEIAARGGGSRIYSHIAPYLSGVPVPRLYLKYCLGDQSVWPAPERAERAAVLEFFSLPPGTVRAISGVEEARAVPGVVELNIELSAGQYFAGVDNDRSRPGYLVAFGRTREEVLRTAAAVKKLVRVELN